ncbi:MAG: saccharopine dehydrogenase C-terminal domain-containing protein [Gammaproteobacteria bacterium]
MKRIAIVGAGRIGSMAACLLANAHYAVMLVDHKKNPTVDQLLKHFSNIQFQHVDVDDQKSLLQAIKSNETELILAAVPFDVGVKVAECAKEISSHYVDFTEDVFATESVASLVENTKSAFMPQCGFAPGLIDIYAHELAGEFEDIESIRIRAGALPEHVDNPLHYAITWSIEGCINQYINPCPAILKGEKKMLNALSDLELVTIAGKKFEAFNTSGGIGGLVKEMIGRVNNINYKTLRYPGHCEKMRFLIKDLKLNEDPETLKKILLNVLPETQQDFVVIFVAATGRNAGPESPLEEKTIVRHFKPEEISGMNWSAIQIVTAAEACAAIELLFKGNYHGLIPNTQFTLEEIMNTEFGVYLRGEEGAA